MLVYFVSDDLEDMCLQEKYEMREESSESGIGSGQGRVISDRFDVGRREHSNGAIIDLSVPPIV